ncbi:putative acetyltransferase [Isoptericola jiangsuensis]|uniref:Putative acetyltransferase n=1 Tax=Isoptericola jiangsuensis TaxID=548579 RepID=A0A2A9ERI3_9MICO|nr:GNAT family N-acetyltransferase [Isoptericola jiangsuensis]PFG41737.1 putative acetyltransferase [Isoptericola jiangsuensis]
MTLEIRRSVIDDVPAARRLGAEAFGVPTTPPPDPDPADWPRPNTRPWTATDDGEVVATLAVRSFTSWFHGARVPTAGFAGVTVAAEHRGSGLLRPLMEAALAEARDLGEQVSTLYPSSAGIYRGLGYEVVGAFEDVTIPMAALAAVAPAAGVRTRRATAADVPAIRRVYETWASAQNGPLTRRERPFTMEPDEMVGADADLTGVSLAVRGSGAGEVLGFASWSRGRGYDRTTTMEVEDLVALTPDAARALWRTLGSFASVVGQVQVCTSGGWSGVDVARLVLPDHAATSVPRPYMLRLLDVPGALAGSRVPPVAARVPFAVTDPRTPDLEGAWTLEAADGRVRVLPDADAVPGDRPTFTSGGLALTWSGAQSAANVRLAGGLTGPDGHDATWDALWGGRQVHVRDYF